MDSHGRVLNPAVQRALGRKDRVTGELVPLALTEHPADEFITRTDALKHLMHLCDFNC